jgi:molybdate transport system ATP-binding protein
MSLEFDISHRLGTFDIEARFATAGRITAIFGPSGSGKTSVVNMIGGLMRPRRGRIAVDGRVLVDTAAAIFLPSHRRRIGYVFQDARLFPHMTVGQNLRYGRFFAPRSERFARFEDVVELLGIGHLLERRPSLLSGGEKQRVAIGRALLASPRLILMDEPLASLDDARKAEIIPFLERLRDETSVPIVYVSHSVAEVARLADDLVVMDRGRVGAAGPATEILRRLDIMPGEAHSGGGSMLVLEVTGHERRHGLSVLRSSGGEWRLPLVDAGIGSKVRVVVRARDVMIATARPDAISALNVIDAVVASIEDHGSAEALVTMTSGGDGIVALVTRRSVEMLALRPGLAVHAIVKSVGVEGVFPAPRQAG